MKMDEIKELNRAEIDVRLKEALEEYSNLKFRLALHQLDNPLKVRTARRDIARLKTVLKEFGLGKRKEGKIEPA